MATTTVRRAAVAVTAFVGAFVTVVGSASVAEAVTTTTPPPVARPSAARVIDSSYFGANTPGTSTNEPASASSESVGIPLDAASLPASTFGTIRYWDDPEPLSTRWCDVQPTASTNIDAALTERLDPKLDAAAAGKARRVIIVLGHAAPWVYDSKAGAGTVPFTPWFCGGQASALAVPSLASLGTSNAPGVAAKRWAAYVSAVLAHINAKFNGKAPFEVALQTFNEPNWMLATTTGLPGTATTPADAAASLSRLDAIVRALIRAEASNGSTAFRLWTSPITCSRSEFSRTYLELADAAQRFSGRYDGVSLQTYSSTAKGARTVEELIAQYNTGGIQRITAALQLLPSLRSLPRHQTETNHALAIAGTPTPIAAAAAPQSISISGQRILLARLLVDGLRWNLSSQVLYTANPRIMGLKLGLTPEGAVTGDRQLINTMLEVRRWISGKRFAGCTESTGRVFCSLSDPRTKAPRQIVYSATGAPVRVAVPKWAHTVRTIEGVSRSVRPGSVITVYAAPRLFS